MKKSISFIVFASLLLLASCQKDAVENPGGGSGAPLKKLVQTTVSGNMSLVYNADGTLKQTTKVTQGYTYVKNFDYAPGKVSYITLQGGKKLETGEYTMVNGKAVSVSLTYYDAYEDPYLTRTKTFQYNIKGLLEKVTYYDGSYSIFIYDANSNLTERTYYNNQGQGLNKSEFFYGSQKDLSPRFGFFEFSGESFLTSPYATYLPVKWKETDLLTAQVTYEDVMQYELDAQGYVLKGKTHVITGPYNDWEWTNSFE